MHSQNQSLQIKLSHQTEFIFGVGSVSKQNAYMTGSMATEAMNSSTAMHAFTYSLVFLFLVASFTYNKDSSVFTLYTYLNYSLLIILFFFSVIILATE